MKILQLGKAYPPVNLGGVEVVIQLCAEGLNRAGIETDALGVNDKHKYSVEQGPFGGKIYRAKLLKKAFSTLFSFHLILCLKKIQKNYDVIHIHSPDPMAGIALFLCRPKSKIVLHWHSDVLRQKLLLKVYNPVLKWLLRRADLVLATSPNYIKGSEYLTKVAYKTKVLPIGIDDTVYSGQHKYNLPDGIEGKKIIFSLGRLAYYKGYEYLVKAAYFLPENYVILIGGSGNEKQKLLNIIKEYALEKKVFLLGKINDLEKEILFATCDVFALSSIYKTEAYAIVQVEAMKYGKPIVSTRIEGSGVDWVNAHNESGLTVPIENAEVLAKAITTILEDKNLYNKLSFGAKARYTENFTDKLMIQSLMSMYKELGV